jgi:hypothetical protein
MGVAKKVKHKTESMTGRTRKFIGKATGTVPWKPRARHSKYPTT